MIGSTISHYPITGKLGAGGMGEVYRATDSKLDRDVAIKVMPEEFAENAERVARFEREAKALAKLNHPNIGTIHGFDQHEGKWFLVLELIEGETLSERLRTGPMPVDEALKVFRQIAEALEAAHEKQIVHRDLKPANVKIDPQGRVKVLDFGLAKARFSARPSTDSDAPTADSDGPTITSEFTMPGKVMGTAAYMSPEQSRGQDVDRRTDVWAFGCCLYEALTGKKPFKGQTSSDVLAAILRADPDFTVVPPETPSEVLTLLRRCLEKEPQRRLRYLGDIALTLEDVTETSRLHAVPPATETMSEPQGASGLRSLKKILQTLGSVVLGLGFAYAVLDLVFFREQGKSTPVQAISSIAVLPFEASETDTNATQLAQWVPDDINVALQKLNIFDHVPPWSLAKAFSANTPPNLAASDLEVQAIVQGRVRPEGDEMRFNLELIDGVSSIRIWGDSFRTDDHDIEGLKRRMVEALLTEGLKRSLTTSDFRKKLGPTRKVNTEAYSAFRRGLQSYFTFSEEGVSEAVDQFEKAIHLDPNYVEPIVFKSASEWVLPAHGLGSKTPKQGFEEARKSLKEAIAMEPNNGSVLWAQGWNAMAGDWDWFNAKKFFRSANSVNLEDPDHYEGIMIYKFTVEGNYEEAFDYLERGLELEPDNIPLLSAKAFILSFFGHFEEAIALHEEHLDRDPENLNHLIGTAQSFASLGRGEPARQAAKEADKLSNGSTTTPLILASILARFGNRPHSESILQEMETKAETTYVSSYYLAEVHAHLGNWDAAFQWLEKGFERKDGFDYVELRQHERLELWGDQPRYWDLVEKMKFPALPIQHPFYEKEQEMRYGRTPASGSTVTAITDTPATELDKNRIVVLPFEALGKEDDDLAFAESLTLAVRMQLNKVEELTVLDGSWLNVRSGSDLVANYKELKAGTVLNGKVHQIGNQLVVNWELRDSQSPELLTSGEEGTTTEEVFSGRGEIASSVARALKVELLPAEESELNELPTDSAEAYKLYTQGRALWNRRTIPDFEKATNYFHQAIALDREFALAHSGLADCHLLWDYYEGTQQGKNQAYAVEMAKKASGLNPLLAAPHATLGFSSWYSDWEWERSEKHFKAALKLDSTYAPTYHWYALMLMCVQRPEEAIEVARRGAHLDTAPIIQLTYAQALYRSGNIREGIEHLKQLIVDHPEFPNSHTFLSNAYAEIGMFDEADAAIENMRNARIPLQRATVVEALGAALMNRHNEARRLLSKLKEVNSDEITRGVHVALIHHLLGNDETALTLLERLVEDRSSLLLDLFFSQSNWKKLHDHPRYQAILRKVGLAK